MATGRTLVTVRGLGKQYRIGASPGPDTLRDHIAAAVGRVLRRRAAPASEHDTFWALRGVSFDVAEGEVVGVVGRNGAGKSTLLKILSQITEPTEGEVRLRARVASLLEVGTGFHPELTGRENIFLNGAILGMGRAEIARSFDAIVAFAEIERFLDTPVKRYSSGMAVRLAFAVAAHLEPEILIVDEVLAVGDAAFQEKCLNKIREVAGSGRTILFVSHNLGSIASLADRCVYLRQGCVAAIGPSSEVVETYLSHATRTTAAAGDLAEYRRGRVADAYVHIVGLDVAGEHDRSSGLPVVPLGTTITCRVHLRVWRPLAGALMVLKVKSLRGGTACVVASWDHGVSLMLAPGVHTVSVGLDDLHLAPGVYLVDIGINQSTSTRAHEVLVDVPFVEVVNTGLVTHWMDRPWGLVHCSSVSWHVSPGGPRGDADC